MQEKMLDEIDEIVDKVQQEAGLNKDDMPK
jgi:hypothetical protein